jgi:hypothetical protein
MPIKLPVGAFQISVQSFTIIKLHYLSPINLRG